MFNKKNEKDVVWQIYNELPDEILIKIFKFLNTKELARVSRVCRQFHRILEDDTWWIQPSHSNIPASFFKIIKHREIERAFNRPILGSLIGANVPLVQKLQYIIIGLDALLWRKHYSLISNDNNFSNRTEGFINRNLTVSEVVKDFCEYIYDYYKKMMKIAKFGLASIGITLLIMLVVNDPVSAAIYGCSFSKFFLLLSMNPYKQCMDLIEDLKKFGDYITTLTNSLTANNTGNVELNNEILLEEFIGGDDIEGANNNNNNNNYTM